MNIKEVEFSSSQYYKEEHPKKQIYIHHTAGNSSGEQVFSGWASNGDRIATCVSISGDGTVVQGFSSKYWAYHLGVKQNVFATQGLPFVYLDKISIGIEICNWGQLTMKDGAFYNYVNRVVPNDQVCELDKPFKGFKFYHNYTDAQIDSVRDLLVLWGDKYKIPISYNEDIWDINKRALSGQPGVFTHNSVRKDKVDIYPHPKMIDMLKSL